MSEDAGIEAVALLALALGVNGSLSYDEAMPIVLEALKLARAAENEARSRIKQGTGE